MTISHEEMRFLRRELINYYLINKPYPLYLANNPFFLHDIKFMVRNSEVYRYNMELKAYSKG